MNSKKFCLLYAIIYCVTSAEPIPAKDCGSPGIKLVSIDISGCLKFPCILNKNTKETLVATITARNLSHI